MNWPNQAFLNGAICGCIVGLLAAFGAVAMIPHSPIAVIVLLAIGLVCIPVSLWLGIRSLD